MGLFYFGLMGLVAILVVLIFMYVKNRRENRNIVNENGDLRNQAEVATQQNNQFGIRFIGMANEVKRLQKENIALRKKLRLYEREKERNPIIDGRYYRYETNTTPRGFADDDDSEAELNLDDILNKIANQGIESLSEEERNFLKNNEQED